MKTLFPVFVIIAALCLWSSCNLFKSKDHVTRSSVIIDESRIIGTDGHSGQLFDILTAKSTGLNFLNTLPDNYANNYWRYTFVYNGGSVNVCDFNNDGLPDIFFTGVMVPHKIFINKGNLQFEDITNSSGIFKNEYEWTSGSTVADVNADGWMDIYICNTRRDDPEQRKKRLFMNNGDLTFTDKAKESGLDDTTTASTANFFDYDNDGDLDMYLVTHPMDFINKFKTVYYQKIETKQNLSNKLYRNNGDGTFTDVHLEAGINNHGFGLACSVGDVDDNGYLDIYVANDFGMYDFLYLNNGDGTFKDVSLSAIKRHDVSSMGTDIADYNNDGLLDIYNADIEMEENYTYKTFQISSQIEVVRTLIHAGYGYQKHGNSLKLNNGNGTFSEVARTAGVGVTDWGWSSFFSDFDNDGLKDLFVSTGYLQDFAVDETETYNKLRRACRINDSTIYYTLINSIPKYVLNHPNFIYKNNGDLTFKDMRDEWGIYFPSVSYGAASADFDLDGDLDIVCSNANDNPFIYRNNSETLNPDHHYLKIKLKGYGKNLNGLGTKIKIYCGASMQYIQHTNVRGYISTTEDILHFGLGINKQVDRIEIEWLDGKKQILNHIHADQTILIDHANASETVIFAKQSPALNYFTHITESAGLNYRHRENDYDDFRREFLLPHKMSRMGPCLAVGDVDGNGLDDIYIGGTFEKPGAIYLQVSPHQFKIASDQLPQPVTKTEDGGALFFDANNDGKMDLYIAGGGNEQPANDKSYADRFYFNTGNGKFILSNHLIPENTASKSCITACDYDKDGDMDLFLGGRQYPGQYLRSVSSFILRNDFSSGPDGKFTDVTKQVAPALENIGMVTSSLWTDFDNDNFVDLIVSGDWMTPQFFKTTNGSFVNVTAKTNLKYTSGWWQSMNGSDLDNDGDTDYILGNFGTNRRYLNTVSERTGERLPMEGFLNDFDHNGTQDIVLAYYQHDQFYTIQLRERLLEQIPGLRKKIPTWDWYGHATVYDIFSDADLKSSIHKDAYEFKSIVLINDGDLNFTIKELPVEAQIAPLFGSIIEDFNEDGINDILCHGNYYDTDILIMRHDAGTGLLLLGNGDGTFKPVRSYISGFWSDGDARSLTSVFCGEDHSPLIVCGVNAASTRVYEFSANKIISLQPDDAIAYIVYENGKTGKFELYNGSGYLSQKSKYIIATSLMRSVKVISNKGVERNISVGQLFNLPAPQ